MMNYIPARLVKGQTWYIVYYAWDPATRERERFRQTYDLNRIKSIRERMNKARLIIAEINRKLPHGYPFTEQAHQDKLQLTSIETAVLKALAIKCVGARPATIHSYNSIADIFLKYLTKNKDNDKPVTTFTRVDAIIFMDEMNAKKIAPRTFNNYVRILKVLFNALLERQYVSVNPFVGIPKSSISSKTRQCIDLEDAKIILGHASTQDRPLYIAMLLQYHCFIRPNELRFLKARHIDFNAGVIRLPGSITKNRKDSIITIPDSIKKPLMDFTSKMGRDCFLFGKGGHPGMDGPVGANTMGARHLTLIRKLKKLGYLESVVGYSYYSWKDTGATALIQAGIPVDEVMKQLRHSSLATTQVYINSLHQVNEKIKGHGSLLV